MPKNAGNLSTWPFPAADHARAQDLSRSRRSDDVQPAEQELVDEQMQRDREAARQTSPPEAGSQNSKG